MPIRSVVAAASIIVTTGLACARDDLPPLGIYESRCQPTVSCTVAVSSADREDRPIVTFRAYDERGAGKVICLIEVKTRPGEGRTTSGGDEIGGSIGKVAGVPFVLTGLSSGDVLLSLQGQICPMRGLPNGGTHLPFPGIYERQVLD